MAELAATTPAAAAPKAPSVSDKIRAHLAKAGGEGNEFGSKGYWDSFYKECGIFLQRPPPSPSLTPALAG